MNRLSDVLISLLEGVPTSMGGQEQGVAVHLDDVKLRLPLKIRMSRGGLLASPAESRLSTGFDTPPSHAAFHFQCIKS